MNKTLKIIIAFGIAIAITSTVLVVSIIKTKKADSQQTSAPLYTLQPTTLPANVVGTDSWVDLNMIASNLATATDTSATDTSSTLPVGITQTIIPNGSYNVTSIVYVDQYGNPVDINQLTQTTPDTQNNEPSYDNTAQFNDTPTTTEADGQMSEFEINSDGVITGYYGSSSVVILPAQLQGKTVTGIGNNCFKGSRITSIQIPETVKSIGSAAFQGCIKLRNVIFASSEVDVTIGASAFKGCESLKNINLPVTSSIGVSAFEGCTSLESIDIKKGCKSVGQYCFAYCTSLTKITVRDEETKFNGVSTFQDRNPDLVVYCVADSNVDLQLKGLGLSTAPITK